MKVIWFLSLLTLIWVGFLGVRFEAWSGGGGVKITKTRFNYARNLKFGAYLHTHI